MRRRHVTPVASFHMLACAALLALCAPGSAAAQQVTLSGVVREAVDGGAVPSAAVHVMDGPGTTTDARGRFTLPRVQPGSLQLVVQAFGYRTRTLDIVLRGDTAIVVELEASAVGLDSLVAEARTVTIRGSIRSAADGQALLDAQVTEYPRGRTIGAVSGNYRINGVPAGEPVVLAFEGLQYLPQQVRVVALADTTITVHLAVDSVAVRMMALQVKRLERRSAAVPLHAEFVGRTELLRTATTVGEAVQRRLPPGAIPTLARDWQRTNMCIVIDDRSMISVPELMTMAPDLIEHVEIYRGPAGGRAAPTIVAANSRPIGGTGGGMVRIYTRRYIARLGGVQNLPPLFFPMVCR